MDDIDFEDQACSKIIDEFKRQAENYQIPEAKFFISSADKDVASLAIDCIASKYEISPNWNDDKRKIYVTQEIEHLQNLVVQAIYRIKKRKFEREMFKVREEMKKDLSPEDLEIELHKYQKLKEAEKMLGQLLGNIVIK